MFNLICIEMSVHIGLRSIQRGGDIYESKTQKYKNILMVIYEPRVFLRKFVYPVRHYDIIAPSVQKKN